MKQHMPKAMALTERHLLYIDLLGFAELVLNEPVKVAALYRLIDSVEVHEMAHFGTIVFSDTLLVYSLQNVGGDVSRHAEVTRLAEFAVDLWYRSAKAGLFFRAVITKGTFAHYKLRHTECFYGSALVRAYRLEKRIGAVGLFVTAECRNDLALPMAPYDNELSFAYLSWSLEKLQELSRGVFPIEGRLLRSEDVDWGLTRDIPILKSIHELMCNDPDPRVRQKYLTTWWYLRSRYPTMLDGLESAQFDLRAISRDVQWDKAAKERDVPFGNLFQPMPRAGAKPTKRLPG